MKIINGLSQGSAAWHEHRSNHFNASDAPAMLGISKYKSREKLLQEISTGITADIDAATERRFADGHRFEALARVRAEGIVGDELYPVVGSEGKLSASFDGLTMDGLICFEHKTLNDALRKSFAAGTIPAQYCAQMEQQLMVSGAQKCLFMASKWDTNDCCIGEMFAWYESNPTLRENITQGWVQFAIDLGNYQHVEAAPEVVAAPIIGLPALSIQVNGSISLISNIEKFGARLNEFVGNINKEPSDDQGFADAESAIKTLQFAQDALEAAEANALAQTSDIDDMRKTVKMYADTARTTRLMLEKMVKARKVSIRIEIIQAAKEAYAAHYKALEAEIRPIVLMQEMPKFTEAIMGKRTISSLREAADTMLRNAKIGADVVAADIRLKLAWCKDSSKGFGFLFNDLQSIIYKPMDDFQLVVKTRIAAHQAEESAKIEAQRIAMQAEADRKAIAAADAAIAKAKAEQDAVMAAERVKIEAEARFKAQEESDARRKLESAERARLDDIALTDKVQFKAPSISEMTSIKQEINSCHGSILDDYSPRFVIELIMHELSLNSDQACDLIIAVADELRSAA